MSVSGVPCRDIGSGDSDGCGVGSAGGSSGASVAIEMFETLLFLAVLAAAALRRLGGDFLVGDNGSSTTLSGGLKICEGSTDSLALFCRRAAVRLLGVVASPAVFLLGDRVLFAGAGVKSSSSSSSPVWLTTLFSMSELPSSWMTGRRRAAARREGRSGDAADIVIDSDRIARCDRIVLGCLVLHFHVLSMESCACCCLASLGKAPLGFNRVNHELHVTAIQLDWT